MRLLSSIALLAGVCMVCAFQSKPPKPEPAPTFTKNVAPFLKKYCVGCHTGADAADNIDFSKIKTEADAKKNLKILKKAVAEVEKKAMPPKGSTMPTATETKAFSTWVKAQKA